MMKFSKDYSKLNQTFFTTIRKNTRHYRSIGIRSRAISIQSPTKEFKAYIIEIETLKKSQITEELALSDAECSRAELIAMLEKWYGKEFDDFILITLKRKESGK